MFFKLVKYELKSVGKWYLGLYALSLVMAFVLRSLVPEFQTLGQSVNLSGWLFTLYSFSLTATFVLIVAMMIATIFIICRRFSQDIFGRQGYLTMTLPVSTHQLLTSKIFVSLLWCFFNALIIFVSIGVISYGLLDYSQLTVFWDQIKGVNLTITVIQWLLYLSLSAIREILTIYLAIALGHLFRNRRTLISFLFYFLLVIVTTLIGTFVQDVLADQDSYLFIVSLLELVYIGLYYGATHFIIKNRLNL